jgi:hypothetical protein
MFAVKQLSKHQFLLDEGYFQKNVLQILKHFTFKKIKLNKKPVGICTRNTNWKCQFFLVNFHEMKITFWNFSEF